MLLLRVIHVSHHHKQKTAHLLLYKHAKEIKFFVRERLSEILATDFSCHRYAITKIKLFTYACFIAYSNHTHNPIQGTMAV